MFNFLFFLIPLVFYVKTSEVFEFNKMILTYILTALIVSFWIVRIIGKKKIIFRRTILDIPLLIFLGSQLVSTLLSIEPRTSWLGYYSRFNGGLLSSVCYSLLYWAFVSNLEAGDVKVAISFWLLPSALIVASYGILEHFGGSFSCYLLTGKLDDNCWVQDVRTRVFATLGQPNWMAAYLVALLPLTWLKILEHFGSKGKFKKIFSFAVSAAIFWAILYTKSRSALLGLGAAGLIFGVLTLANNKSGIKKVILPFSLLAMLMLIAVGLSGTPWSPSIADRLNKKAVNLTNQLNATSEGGTESGSIRKIVWKGAINIWRAYPVFGTGPETFAFTYYMYRPVEHNLVSEWDFLYNKAHNEYLNYLANTGAVGLGSYLVLIAFGVYVLRRDPALLAGYAGILITNFFGFSVVITQLLLFLLPAMAISLGKQETADEKLAFTASQKLFTGVLLALFLYLISTIYNYWRADALYARAKAEIELGRISDSVHNLNSAIKKVPQEPLYHDKLAQVYAAVAKASKSEKDASSAAQLSQIAIAEADTALDLAPKNFVILQDRVNIYSDLASIDSSYLLESIKTLENLTAYAPTYAKIYYKLGLAYLKINQRDKARQNLEKAVELKTDYEEAKKALNTI